MASNRSWLHSLLVFQLATIYGRPLEVPEQEKNVSKAIVFVINEFFAKQTSSMAVSVETERQEATAFYSDILNEVLLDVDSLTFQLDLYNELNITFVSYFNLFMVDSYESFRRIYTEELSEWQSYDYTGYYLIFLSRTENDHYDTMLRIFKDCWSLYLVNVNILMETLVNDIQMYTYFPYNRFDCGQVNPIIINRFVNGAMTSNTIFPDKLANMYRCPITVLAWPNPPYMIIKQREDGVRHYSGIDGVILENLAQTLNFNIELVEPTQEHRRGDVFENGSITGSFKLLSDGKANFTIGGFRYNEIRAKYFATTHSYYYTSLVFVVPPGSPFTSLELLFFPFGNIIWMALGIAFFCGILITTVLKYSRDTFRWFIIGKGNHQPFFNMIAGFFGNPVLPEPKRNFARFLLVLWILNSLVIRSSYQGSLYDFLRTDRVKSPPDKLIELTVKNYTIRMNENSMTIISNFKGLQRLTVPMSGSIFSNFLDLQQNNSRTAVFCTKDFITYYNNKHYRNGSLHIVTERLFAHPNCIYLRKNSYLTKDFNEVLLKFMSGGLVQKWSSNIVDEKFNKNIQIYRYPKKLTNNQLAGSYQLYFIFIISSIIVFIFELLSYRYRVGRMCSNG